MLKCVILDDYQQVALRMADWSVLEGKVELVVLQEHIEDEEALAVHLADADILVAMRERTPLKAALLGRLHRLKLIVTSGMRNASIDMQAAATAGIMVCGTASRSEPPVELTWALILGLARGFPQELQAFRGSGAWQSTVGADLHGSTLGLIGLGKLGSRMARIGQAFGMHVLAWSPNLTQERAEEHGAQLAGSKEELLASGDYVSLHMVLSERTRHLIGEADLRKMKPTAYLINTSRAGLVDQQAMVEALQEKRIAGAGLDVFEVEPLPAGHVLRNLPNVLATPHLGYVTEGNYQLYFRGAVENIAAYLAGAPIRVLNG